MGLLKKASGPGYLKAGFLGFQSSGKTYTATSLAIGTRAHFGLSGPIAMFDTESGSDYIKSRVLEETGEELLALKSRSLDDLLEVGQECIDNGVSVLVVDSMTHIWRDCVDSYLANINENRQQKGWGLKTDLEFRDWGPIKKTFGRWTEFFLNSPLHIVICGRAGFDYDFEEDKRGKKELVKTGVKMKTEGEFGYEPSLLIEMEAIQERSKGKLTGKVKRVATVLKCRFDLIDGKTFNNPTYQHFASHVQGLSPASHQAIDMSLKTDTGVAEDGTDEWAVERKRRQVICEEIQSELLEAFPSQSALDKRGKSRVIRTIFDTGSWTRVEGMRSGDLRDGLDRLQLLLADRDSLEAVLSAPPVQTKGPKPAPQNGAQA